MASTLRAVSIRSLALVTVAVGLGACAVAPAASPRTESTGGAIRVDSSEILVP